MPDRHPGFFGKLPAHGDFIDRGLPRAFITPWDQWLQGCIANSRELLGARWLDCYLVGPIWRFALAPGICGRPGWRGLLLPSVDRVNRYYPLTIAMPETEDVSPLAALTGCDAWFAACEDAALEALDPSTGADQLAERLQTVVPGVPRPNQVRCPRFSAEGASAWHLELPTDRADAALEVIVAEALMHHAYAHCSLWWTAGSDAIGPSLLIHRGLPNVHDFAALLDGQWRHWGWASCTAVRPSPGAVDGGDQPDVVVSSPAASGAAAIAPAETPSGSEGPEMERPETRSNESASAGHPPPPSSTESTTASSDQLDDPQR